MLALGGKPAPPTQDQHAAEPDQPAQRSYQAFADLVNWMADNPELRARLTRRQIIRRVGLHVEWTGPEDRIVIEHDLERG